MWIFRYFLPGVFAVALGIFVAQNLGQRTSIQFLFWRFYDIPLIGIIAITLIVGIFIRYYVIFIKWLDRKRLAWETKKIVRAHRAEEDLRIKKDYSKEIEEVAEERMRKTMEDEEKTENREEK